MKVSVRTDLAVESLTAAAAIEPKQRGTYFQITEVTISNAEQAAAVGKPEGHYLTLETAALHRHNPQFPQLAEELGRELRAFYITIKNDHCLKNQLLFSYLCFQKSFIVQSNVQT